MTNKTSSILNQMNKINYELNNCRKECKQINEIVAPNDLYLAVRHKKSIAGEVYYDHCRINTEDLSLINKIIKTVTDHYKEKEDQCNQKLESLIEELKQG